MANVFTGVIQLMWVLCGLGVAVGVCVAPFQLYKRYRRLYADSPDFRLELTEQVAQGAFRGGEQSFEEQVRMNPSAEWVAKLGFFLGIVGFLWTPLVLLGAIASERLPPMVTVGLPGLVVSWAAFLAARAMLKKGPRAAPLLRFSAVSTIVLNVWVVALVVITTLYEMQAFDDTTRAAVESLLLVRPGHSHSDMDAYKLVYSIDKLGVASLLYAVVSFLHARLTLRAWSSLEAARRVQLRAASLAPSAAE